MATSWSIVSHADLLLPQCSISRLLSRHQFGDSRFEYLLLTLVCLRHRLIVFIRREPGDGRFTILELTNQQDIADSQLRKLARFRRSRLFQHRA